MGAAGEGEAAGDGEGSVRWAVQVQAQLQGTYLHRGGEAGVDVQVVDLVQAGPGKLEGQVPGGTGGG